jgi:hypothetical protein
VHSLNMSSICTGRANTRSGLGDYLHTLDSTRAWDEHLQYILVFCTVHLQRNFAKKFPQHPLRYTIIQEILRARSRQEIVSHMRYTCQQYPELQSWLNHKQPQWIISGIAQAESKVRPEYWLNARKHTGNSESSHFQENNFTGRRSPSYVRF